MHHLGLALRQAVAGAGLALLTACASPLADVERLSDVEGDHGVGGPGALAGPGEGEGDPGVVGALVASARERGLRVVPGQVLPFGQVGTACGLVGRELGTPVDASAGYVIHDTDPTTVAPRTHFVTGFDDGCARQVTAALAMFGDLATHETQRYATPQGAYGAVDAAYEAVKARVCGVASGQPCGARMDRLAADTAFVSLYPAFGGDAPVDVLLHGGEVLAAGG